MTPALRETILKGVFVGVWAYLALSLPAGAAFGRVVLFTLAGTGLGLLAGAIWQLRRGHRPGANPLGFLLLTLLDSAYFVYPGLVGGAALGAFLETDPPAAAPRLLPACIAAGALLGLILDRLRPIRSRWYRLGLGLLLGVGLTAFGLHYLPLWPATQDPSAQRLFAEYLLAGLPLFALLMFAGESEESEAEVAALCAGFGLGLYLLRLESRIPEQFEKLIFLAPLGLYFVLATRTLPRVRVFKQTLRGYAHLSAGRAEPALGHFVRALRLDPKSELASGGLARLVRTADLGAMSEASQDLLPVPFCLDLAEQSLLGHAPTAKEVGDALRLIAATERRPGASAARAAYLRAVGLTHRGDYDAAAMELSQLLDPAGPLAESPTRPATLLPAWMLAVSLHPALRERLGGAELAKPGRRVEALLAVEARLANSPDDPAGVELKRQLYSGLTEAELAHAGDPAGLNYDYLDQLGQSLLAGEPERGAGYLRMAARGLPGRAVALFDQLARHAQDSGDTEAATGYLNQIKRAGVGVGPKSLGVEDRAIYLRALDALAASAEARGDLVTAVEDYRLFVEASEVTPDSLRRLAELYASAGDPLNAAVVAERGLLYAKADADLLAKKQSYYFSIPIDRVAAARQQVAPWFDVAHCVATAGRVADQREADADTLDYGLHLARLARAVRPDSQAAMLAEARLLLRAGERDAGLALLEDLRALPRGSGDDEDAWFAGTRLLGAIYLDEIDRPDLAADCFNAYRESPRSGAETLFQLGRALERAGDSAGAIRAYEGVSKAYGSHPRAHEAGEAARRLRAELSRAAE